jgi:hypothetical protein
MDAKIPFQSQNSEIIDFAFRLMDKYLHQVCEKERLHLTPQENRKKIERMV